MYEKNIERWITAHPGGNKEAEGQPIPVKKGQTNKEATESFFAKKSKFKAKNPESKEREEFTKQMNLPHERTDQYFDEIQKRDFTPNLNKDNFEVKDKDVYEQGEILGVKRGNVMTFSEADNNNVNPKYNSEDEYNINCQACVPVFEARLRGYDLEVLPYSKNGVFKELEQNPEKIYKGAEVQYISLNKETKNGNFYRVNLTTELSKKINNNERFNVVYNWLNDYTGNMGGHILECHKINDKLNLYDPQSNSIYRGSDIDTVIGWYASNIKIYRVDNLKFDVEKLSKICKKRSKR